MNPYYAQIDKKMNLPNYFLHFWRENAKQNFSPFEAVVYFFLLNKANELRFEMPFQLTDNSIAAALNFSRDSVFRSKKELSNRNLIRFEAQKGRAAGSLFWLLNVGENVRIKDNLGENVGENVRIKDNLGENVGENVRIKDNLGETRTSIYNNNNNNNNLSSASDSEFLAVNYNFAWFQNANNLKKIIEWLRSEGVMYCRVQKTDAEIESEWRSCVAWYKGKNTTGAFVDWRFGFARWLQNTKPDSNKKSYIINPII